MTIIRTRAGRYYGISTASKNAAAMAVNHGIVFKLN